MTPLFSARALKRRHRVGERSGPITLLSPPLKATLALGVLIAVGGGLWATLARIPLTVEGVGVLLPVASISTSVSQSDGVAHWMFPQPSSPWHQQAWRFQQRPGSLSDQDMVALSRSLLAAYAQPQSAPGRAASQGVELSRWRGEHLAAGRLLVWVQAPAQIANLSSALKQLERTLADSQAQQRNIEAQQVVLRREYSSRSQYLASMQRLATRGFVSRAAILDEKAAVDGIASQIHSNDNKLIALAQDRDQTYQTLRAQLATLLQQQLIFAPRELYLDGVQVLNGEGVSRGEELLKLSDQSLNDPNLVPMFLGSNETAQVRVGMTALATPAGYKRAEVGGIRGRVVFKARLPGNLATVSSRVGVRSLAEQIVAQEPAPTLVILALERAANGGGVNSGGYQWSSRSDLPFPPTPGERLDVEITTRQVRPIELVFPIVKQVLGLAPPDRPSAPRQGGTRL